MFVFIFISILGFKNPEITLDVAIHKYFTGDLYCRWRCTRSALPDFRPSWDREDDDVGRIHQTGLDHELIVTFLNCKAR